MIVLEKNNLNLLLDVLKDVHTLPMEMPKDSQVSQLFLEYQNHKINPLNVVRLTYLAKLSKLETKELSLFSPFTQEDEVVFKLAKDRNERTSQWLRVGIVGTTILTAIPFIGTFPSVNKWASESSDHNLSLVRTFLALAVLINVLNFLATGTFPDLRTSSAEDFAVCRRKMDAIVSDLSHELEMMEESKLPEAQQIAQAIDIEKIKSRMLLSLSFEEHDAVVARWGEDLKGAKYTVLRIEPGTADSAVLRHRYRLREYSA